MHVPAGGDLVVKSCPTLCDPVDCSPPGPSVHGILQARTLERVAIYVSNQLVEDADSGKGCVWWIGQRIWEEDSNPHQNSLCSLASASSKGDGPTPSMSEKVIPSRCCLCTPSWVTLPGKGCPTFSQFHLYQLYDAGQGGTPTHLFPITALGKQSLSSPNLPYTKVE